MPAAVWQTRKSKNKNINNSSFRRHTTRHTINTDVLTVRLLVQYCRSFNIFAIFGKLLGSRVYENK